jgi:hypothetical protein
MLVLTSPQVQPLLQFVQGLSVVSLPCAGHACTLNLTFDA